MQLFMTFFALIDFIIYSFVGRMFHLIFLIADVDIFTEKAISGFASKVYGILGVLVLFKIVISCIQYLINPDKMGDKKDGMGALLMRTIISIALLAMVPTIFDLSKELQPMIAKAIPSIIIGREVTGGNDGEAIEEAGNWMAWTTLSTFIEPKEGVELKEDEKIGGFNTFLARIHAGCGFFEPSKCKYNYHFIFSIPVGVFMVYILLSMGIDIAVRAIKLGILQILAPIPIASYINNDEKFKKWYTLSFKVYCDLFIRLIIIYFIVFLMGVIASGGIESNGNAFVTIYIIIALLMFAKGAPKFISDALGLQSDGMGGIADMFTRGAAFGGAGKAAYDTLKSNYITQRNRLSTKTDANGQPLSKGRQLAGALKSAAAGGASAFGRGMWMATWQGKKGFGEVRSAANKAAVAKRDERNEFHDNLEAEDYTWRDYKRDQRNARIGISSASGIIEQNNSNVVAARQNVDAQFAHALKKEDDFKGVVRTSRNGAGFGAYTNGDGDVVNADNVTLAYARRMARISEGEYYDDGMASARKTRILTAAQTDVTNAQREYENAMSMLKTSPDNAAYQIELERTKSEFERTQQRLFDLKNDDRLGLARATAQTAGEWDAIVRKLEKDIRSEVFASLLTKHDPDAIVTHEKSIESLKALQDFAHGNTEASRIITDNGFANIEEIISSMDHKNSAGVYEIDPDKLDKVKIVMERLQGLTNREAMAAAEREKRTKKAIENSTKKS